MEAKINNEKNLIGKTIGHLEYDIKKDVIILSDGAAMIYYNENCKKRVNIEDFFMILSAKSSQCLSKILTDTKNDEIAFVQKVRCMDGKQKKVMVIMSNGSDLSGNRQGICVDVTKSL